MRILIGLVLGSLALAVHAEGTLEVSTTVKKQEQFVNEAGESESRLVAADVVLPGETVFYTITFKNVGDEPADNIVITNPIAEDLMYVDGSGFGPGADMEFSVDGGQTFAPAAELVVTEDGEERAADGRDFTHVRWLMTTDLEAGAQSTARFAAVLE